jgi:hypothetical protein
MLPFVSSVHTKISVVVYLLNGHDKHAKRNSTWVFLHSTIHVAGNLVR